MTMKFSELFHIVRRALSGLAVFALIVIGTVTMLNNERAAGVALMMCAISVVLTLREESRLYKQLLKAGNSFSELPDHLRSI